MEQDFKLGIYLKLINLALDNNCNKKLKDLGITLTQFKILKYLIQNKDKEINQRDLEKGFYLKNPTVTGILNRLEQSKFVKRVVNSTDARFKKIELCEKTLEMEGRLEEIAADMESMITNGMSEAEIKNTYEIMVKILKNLT